MAFSDGVDVGLLYELSQNACLLNRDVDRWGNVTPQPTLLTTMRESHNIAVLPHEVM